MRKYVKIITAYTLVILFVVGWWFFAFEHPSNRSFATGLKNQANEQKFAPPDLTLSSIDRALLQQALAGDFSLMAKYIADWDIDAQLLQSIGFESAKRLPAAEFLRSQLLIRQKDQLPQLEKKNVNQEFLVDAAGGKIDLTKNYNLFLPQTYAAASFLLAIAPTDQIVALPRRLREQVQLYPKSLTDKIPLDIDRHNGEKLFQAKPEIAFVAHYSHPATVQALQNQGVVIYTMKNLTSLQDIDDELLRIGSITNRMQQAEMLKIFIDAAMLALDNKQLLLVHHYEQNHAPFPKVLVLNFHQNFTAPTRKSLTGQILIRLNHFDITTKGAIKNENTSDWMVPIDKERLINLDPDCIIIATDNEAALEKEIRSDPALNRLSAVKKSHLYFVDEAIHHSPTQYVVLAYYDLIQALGNLP